MVRVFGLHNNNSDANHSGLRLLLVSPALPEFAVVSELVAETTELVGVFGGDATAEVENDVAEFVDGSKVRIYEIPLCIKK